MSRKVQIPDDTGIGVSRFAYSNGLDKLLGQVDGGTLLMFFGRQGVGKTTLAGYVPMTEIYRQNKLEDNEVFVFIDGDGGFSFERFEQVAGKDYSDVKARLEYRECVDFNDQHELLASGPGGSPSKLEKDLIDRGLKPALIVMDPFTFAYHGIVTRTDQKHKAAVIQQYAGKLELQLQAMRGIGVRNKCPVIITTWPSSPIGAALADEKTSPNEQPFIGGRALGFLPKIIVELKGIKFGDGSRMAVLFKHRSRPVGAFAKFKLVDQGVDG